ncbi:hypothetical protein G9U51_15740 [Calidifontibacter sp. DB0510]|uniref:Uncharacterized protein n=1 Tax=Metallococcus carri TaxID=1656884 RepID=A0A967B1R9_9MICO|nr:hypothetical protein [Metallococcus carri]NHN57224.1 hypothetical protein [Metallococcus carri]NOP37973.1 hypothetical protein [Calidifontibacter sp. DB2511S]
MLRRYAPVAALLALLFVVANLLVMWGTKHKPAQTIKQPGPLVIVAAPGLTWHDVTQQRYPDLWSVLDYGAMGSQDTGGACTPNAWLTLGAGAAASTGSCTVPQPKVSGSTASWPHWQQWQRDSGSAPLGALAAAYGRRGQCVQAVGAGAALAAADPRGRVARYARSIGAANLSACAVSLVDAGAGRGVATMAQLNAVFAKLPSEATVVLTGLSGEGLGFVYTVGNGVTHGTLTSHSTRQPGLVQTSDLTAFALGRLSTTMPAGVTGQPLLVLPNSTPSKHLAASARDLDQQLRQGDSLVWWLVGLVLVASGALALVARRSAPRWVPPVLVGLGAVPAASYLANVLPWWRWTPGPLWFGLIVLAWAGLGAAIAYAGPWRRSVGAPSLVLAGLTIALVVSDALHDSPLQLGTPLGLRTLATGEHRGIGSAAAGVLVGCVVLLLAAVMRRRPAGALGPVRGDVVVWVAAGVAAVACALLLGVVAGLAVLVVVVPLALAAWTQGLLPADTTIRISRRELLREERARQREAEAEEFAENDDAGEASVRPTDRR